MALSHRRPAPCALPSRFLGLLPAVDEQPRGPSRRPSLLATLPGPAARAAARLRARRCGRRTGDDRAAGHPGLLACATRGRARGRPDRRRAGRRRARPLGAVRAQRRGDLSRPVERAAAGARLRGARCATAHHAPGPGAGPARRLPGAAILAVQSPLVRRLRVLRHHRGGCRRARGDRGRVSVLARVTVARAGGRPCTRLRALVPGRSLRRAAGHTQGGDVRHGLSSGRACRGSARGVRRHVGAHACGSSRMAENGD